MRTYHPPNLRGCAVDESWKPIAGYEDAYEVSDLGRVRSLPREVVSGGLARKRRGVVRRTYPGNKNEPRLFLSIEGRRKSFYVATLVLEAFVSPRPEGMEARHRDGVNANNTLQNLWWGPQADHGPGPTRLNDIHRAIIKMRGEVSQRQAAKKFNVDTGVVRRLWALELVTTES